MTSATVSAGIEQLQCSWGWILALGILMIVLGIVVLFMIPGTTLALCWLPGWLMLFSGFVEDVQTFKSPALQWSIPEPLIGILGVVSRLILVSHLVDGGLVNRRMRRFSNA